MEGAGKWMNSVLFLLMLEFTGSGNPQVSAAAMKDGKPIARVDQNCGGL